MHHEKCTKIEGHVSPSPVRKVYPVVKSSSCVFSDTYNITRIKTLQRARLPNYKKMVKLSHRLRCLSSLHSARLILSLYATPRSVFILVLNLEKK